MKLANASTNKSNRRSAYVGRASICAYGAQFPRKVNCHCVSCKDANVILTRCNGARQAIAATVDRVGGTINTRRTAPLLSIFQGVAP